MPAGQGLDVAGIAQTILTVIENHYKTADNTCLPARRVIAPGNPRLIAWDTEQLVIALSGIGLGAAPTQPGFAQRTGNPVSAAGIRHAVFEIQLVRCVPESKDSMGPPHATTVTASGLALMRDAGLLSQALVEGSDAVAALLGMRGSVEPGAVQTLGPEGGMAAVAGSMAITAGGLV